MERSSLSSASETIPPQHSAPADDPIRKMLLGVYAQTNKDGLRYTLRDGQLDAPCSFEQFERDFHDVLRLVLISGVHQQAAMKVDISDIPTGYHINTGEEHDLTQRLDVQKVVNKELQNPAAEIICTSNSEATHVTRVLSSVLNLMQRIRTWHPETTNEADNSLLLAQTHTNFTGVYLNQDAMKALSGLGHEILSSMTPERLSSIAGQDHDSGELSITHKRYHILLARSVLANLAQGTICFPTEQHTESARGFLKELLPEHTREIQALQALKKNTLSPTLQATAEVMYNAINTALSNGGIDNAFDYLQAQRAIGESQEFMQRHEAMQYFQQQERHRDSSVSLPLDGAPKNCAILLASLAGTKQQGTVYLDEQSHALRIPSFAADQIGKNWQRFLKLAHTSTIDDAMALFPLEGVEVRTRTQPDANAVTSVTKVPTLQEKFPEEMKAIDAVGALLGRICTPSKEDKYLSASGAVELHFRNEQEQMTARELLRHITEQNGVLREKNYGLLIEGGERDTILAFRELFVEELGRAREAIQTGDANSARIHLDALRNDHLGETLCSLAQQWQQKAAGRAH